MSSRPIRFYVLFAAIVAGLLQVSQTARAAQTRPNILWISAEDISPNLGCYGDKYATTPNLDRFAKQGVVFKNAFSHAGVCAVARSGIITGVYPTSIGSQHMRSRIVPPPHIKCFTEYLRAAGYYCTNRSKTDYNFEPPLTAWDESRRNSRDWSGRAKGQPFFSVINLTISHESKIRGRFDKPVHDPAKVKLPPYVPDTPKTRRDRARYYDIITQMDTQAGAILKRLEDDGLADDTIVFFWGDHGEGLPRGKRWVYESGIRVPLMVRWPGKVKPGTSRDELVCFLDFAPTVLSLAGVTPPKYMHGQVILGEKTARPRQYIFAHRDRMDETYDIIRAVRDERFKYIRNFMPRRSRGQNIDYMNKMPTMIEMRRLFAAGKLSGAKLQYFEKTKPVEELYDLLKDPHEVHNVAGKAEYQRTLARMRGALERWQVETNDLGLVPEPLLAERMRPSGKYDVTQPPQATTRKQDGGVVVSLTCATKGASMAYTTGRGRNAHWKLYTKPFAVAAGDTVRAVGCRLGYRNSAETRVSAK